MSEHQINREAIEKTREIVIGLLERVDSLENRVNAQAVVIDRLNKRLGALEVFGEAQSIENDGVHKRLGEAERSIFESVKMIEHLVGKDDERSNGQGEKTIMITQANMEALFDGATVIAGGVQFKASPECLDYHMARNTLSQAVEKRSARDALAAIRTALRAHPDDDLVQKAEDRMSDHDHVMKKLGELAHELFFKGSHAPDLIARPSSTEVIDKAIKVCSECSSLRKEYAENEEMLREVNKKLKALSNNLSDFMS